MEEWKEIQKQLCCLQEAISELRQSVGIGYRQLELQLTTQHVGMESRLSSLDAEFAGMRLSVEHGVHSRLEALLDGYVQSSSRLERMEERLLQSEEIFIRRRMYAQT